MKKSTVLGIVLASTALTPIYAWAQTASTPPAAQAATSTSSATPNTSDSGGIKDIIVTAQRRPERLQNVPISVTAVSGDALQSRALNDLSQVSLVAPSLQITNDNNFSIRGVGTLAFSSSIESSVAFAEDEVNLTNVGLVTDLYDIAQVEVLNGPQGLLFGRNASAGLLNVTTVRPILGRYAANIEVEADDRDTAPGTSDGVVVRANVNIPIGDNAALRLNGLYENQAPFVRFVGPADAPVDLGLQRYGMRAKFLYQPTSRFSIYIIGEYSEDHGGLGLYDDTYRALGPNSVDAAPLASTNIVPGKDNTTVAGDGGYFRNLTRHGLQGKATYLFDNGVEVSDIAAWKSFSFNQQIDEDGTAQNGADINKARDNFSQYTNEFRVALPTMARLSGQVGLYYFHSDYHDDSQIAGNDYFPSFLLPTFPFCVGAKATPGAFPPTCSVSNADFLGNDHKYSQQGDSYAAFGQFTYKVLDDLQLIAGGRVTHDHIAIQLTQNTQPYFVTLGIPFTGSQEYDHTNFSYKVGAQYNLTPHIMGYITYGLGYKGPGFNNNAVSPTGSLVVRPETNNNIEIGAKTSWFAQRLIADISLFSSKFDDYQVQSFDLTTASFITQNAATLNTKGIEATLIGRPITGLTLSAGATFLDSRFGSFPGAACYPTQGCVTFNAKGDTPPLSPKVTATFDANYEFQEWRGLRPFIEANYYHRSDVNFTISPAPGNRYGDTDLLGASIGVHADKWRASLFCKNCTDERVPIAIGQDAGDAFSGVTTYLQHFGLNSFRTIGVQLGYEF